MKKLIFMLFAGVAAFALVWAGCSKKKDDAGDTDKDKTEKREGKKPEARPEKKLSPDEQKCMELATKAHACKKPPRKGHSPILMRACTRDIKDKELRPYQLKMIECAKLDCAKYDECYEKAAKPLRDIHFKRIRARRAGPR
jgi:hypothetical protein